MIIFPAIDLKDGQCVRLKKGVMEDATVFNADPAAQARAFQAQGFNGCIASISTAPLPAKAPMRDAIKAIRAAIDLPIQLGGGIRDLAAVEAWLAAGITRVILGTAALTDPDFVKEAARAFPGRIVVGADAKGGKIATQGWAEVSDLTPVELGRRFEDAGVAAILFTDIDGDGLLKGVNVDGHRRPGPRPFHPGDRLGRGRLHRRYRGPAGRRGSPISKAWWWAGRFMTAGSTRPTGPGSALAPEDLGLAQAAGDLVQLLQVW